MQPEQLDHRASIRRADRARGIPVHVGDELQHFAPGELLVEERLVGNIADELTRLPATLVQVEPADAHAARGREQQAAHHLDGGGFAGAVGAQEREQLAPADGEVQVVDGDLAAVAFGNVVEFDHGVGCTGVKAR